MFFGNSYTAPTPSLHTLQLIGLSMSKASHLGGVPAAPSQPCCGVNHGNQKDLRLSILYKVEIVIISILSSLLFI
jgi:hypothetical protein